MIEKYIRKLRTWSTNKLNIRRQSSINSLVLISHLQLVLYQYIFSFSTYYDNEYSAHKSHIIKYKYLFLLFYRRQSELNLLAQPNLFSHHSRQCVRWTGVEAWNALLLDIRRIDNIDTFKINTKKYILNKQEGAVEL